jgi:hypothetical protein
MYCTWNTVGSGAYITFLGSNQVARLEPFFRSSYSYGYCTRKPSVEPVDRAPVHQQVDGMDTLFPEHTSMTATRTCVYGP